ncbi:MAG TPA: hypothetical protein VFG14_17685 [Chthoniobacteraceae bacterium]|nr:hypothetical protein [Chthoniobacteraceae bacterium]
MRSFWNQHCFTNRFVVSTMRIAEVVRIGKRLLPQWEQDRP